MAQRRGGLALLLMQCAALRVTRVQQCTDAIMLSRRQLLRRLPAGACAVAAPAAFADDLMDVCPNCPQAVNPLPLASILGRWSLSASWTDATGAPRTLVGETQFRSVGKANSGKTSFVRDEPGDDRVAGGAWYEVPAKLYKGQFSWSARWKLKTAGETLLFRGDTSTGDPRDFLENRRPPTMAGDVFVETYGPLEGMMSQRRVGSFSAVLRESWSGSGGDAAKIGGADTRALR